MGEQSPKGAVFLSYASQDAEAARRICDALRAAGFDVWFDQSELRGGDAWDRQIRKQIPNSPGDNIRQPKLAEVSVGRSASVDCPWTRAVYRVTGEPFFCLPAIP
jgi:hypothetical protein